MSFIILLNACGSHLPAQVSVEDKAYDEMLSKLLDHSVPEIKVEELKEHYVLLDSREKEEFDISHIPNGNWIGYSDFDLKRLDQFNKTDTIVVYCSVGYRSEKIAEELLDEGFQHVFNLYGGMFEYCNQSRPMENRDGRTNKIHGYDEDWSQWLKKGEIKYR